MRLIDANALIAEMHNVILEDGEDRRTFYEVIERQPVIDPVKHGMWKSKMLDTFRKYEVTCSECGEKYIGNYDAYDEPYDFEYCPNCGAKMDEEDEDGNT